MNTKKTKSRAKLSKLTISHFNFTDSLQSAYKQATAEQLSIAKAIKQLKAQLQKTQGKKKIAKSKYALLKKAKQTAKNIMLKKAHANYTTLSKEVDDLQEKLGTTKAELIIIKSTLVKIKALTKLVVSFEKTWQSPYNTKKVKSKKQANKHKLTNSSKFLTSESVPATIKQESLNQPNSDITAIDITETDDINESEWA